MKKQSEFKIGDTVYIISNNISVQELRVLNVQGDFYVLRNLETGGGMRLRSNRHFATREEAEAVLSDARRRNKFTDYRSTGRDPHFL